MQGICLKFYTSEFREHQGILLYEWLLERAKKCGFDGGTATRAIAGYGRHGILHEETFLELLRAENIDLFYVRFPIEYGFLPD